MTNTPVHRRRRRLARLAAATTATLLTLAGAPAAHADPPRWHVGIPPLATPWTAQVSPANALPEYPRPQLTRPRWTNLNGVWEFAWAQPGEAPPFGRPLDRRILVPYPPESALSGIQGTGERMFYRRTFTVPAAWKIGSGQRLRLNFGAVDFDAKVWVNGTQVATHRGGYDGFTADVTDALKPAGPQELVVWAEDLSDGTFQPIGKQRKQSDHGIFYQGSSGIWRTVWMEPVPTAAIDKLTTTPDLTAGQLRLTVRATGATGLTVRAIVYDRRHREVGRVTGAPGAVLRVPVPRAKLWSPDSPYLYTLSVDLLRGATKADSVGSYFGMRQIGTKKGADGRLHIALNGKILFTLATLDQGFWPDGLYTAPTDAALRFDLAQTKALGFNTVRKHIKVEPDRWYYAADQLGLMVWQDMPAAKPDPIPADWRGEFESELQTMVDQHASFPSIIGWIPFNEGWGEWNRDDTGRIADAVKKQDPTRLVDAHSGVNCCDSLGDSGRGDVIDYHQYLGPATTVPAGSRVAVDGEHGGFGLKTSNHMWFGDGGGYEMEPDSATLTHKYVANQRDVLTSARACGISGSVYTQITDVEGELNGFYTYDRQVLKMDPAQVRAVNREIIRKADGSGAGAPRPTPGTPGADGIASYPLDGSTADAVGHADLTAVGGPTFAAGKAGQGVALNGNGQYLDAGRPLLNMAADYTVAAWVKLAKVDGAFQSVVSQDGPQNSDFFLQYSGADQRFAMSFVGVRALAAHKPEAGRWYHLVGVRDAAHGQLRLYVDGRLAGTASACQPFTKPTGATVVGRAKYNGGNVDSLDGTVDQVHLYDRVLSAGEVAKLYASGR